MNYAVQAVRGFRGGNTRAASHPFCDIRLLHSGFTVAGECFEAGAPEIVESRYCTENKCLRSP